MAATQGFQHLAGLQAANAEQAHQVKLMRHTTLTCVIAWILTQHVRSASEVISMRQPLL